MGTTFASALPAGAGHRSGGQASGDADGQCTGDRPTWRGRAHPDDVVFRPDLPYTDSGKVQRRILGAQIVAATS
jgi:hypothetical protein